MRAKTVFFHVYIPCLECSKGPVNTIELNLILSKQCPTDSRKMDKLGNPSPQWDEKIKGLSVMYKNLQ